MAESILSWIGIDVRRPLITQVSRFDPWKDPLGVIETYRRVRRAVPDLQLAMVGSLALDDPEAWGISREIDAAAKDDPAIHLFSNLVGVGSIEVNAFQRLSNVIVQKSIREGFGLVVAESLFKGTPVVAGRAGGIPLQMADGVGGILIETTDECAEAVEQLLRDPRHARDLGARGHERVREHFLTPRLLLDELRLMVSLGHEAPSAGERFLTEGRDPVCGMAIVGLAAPATSFGGVTYRFCSERCRASFARQPQRYLGRQ
jgi:trehalose synthase